MKPSLKVGIIAASGTNLTSLTEALKDYDWSLLESPEECQRYDRLLLPGVGHAQFSLDRLAPWKETLLQIKTPLLGICVGMQVLCKYLEEAHQEGLGVFSDPVLAIPQDQPVPHMGWNTLSFAQPHPLFAEIEDASFYFVHSFAAPSGSSTIAHMNYNGSWSAALGKGLYMGVQFHPEKSGLAGRKLLQNFLETPWN